MDKAKILKEFNNCPFIEDKYKGICLEDEWFGYAKGTPLTEVLDGIKESNPEIYEAIILQELMGTDEEVVDNKGDVATECDEDNECTCGTENCKCTEKATEEAMKDSVKSDKKVLTEEEYLAFNNKADENFAKDLAKVLQKYYGETGNLVKSIVCDGVQLVGGTVEIKGVKIDYEASEGENLPATTEQPVEETPAETTTEETTDTTEQDMGSVVDDNTTEPAQETTEQPTEETTTESLDYELMLKELDEKGIEFIKEKYKNNVEVMDLFKEYVTPEIDVSIVNNIAKTLSDASIKYERKLERIKSVLMPLDNKTIQNNLFNAVENAIKKAGLEGKNSIKITGLDKLLEREYNKNNI